ncbi:MAG: hypothetical protein Q8P81_03995 [Nanoarchaeota archaeon]|nr:hypothetical protein [Nanoarchaeota archaeon]
MEKVVKRNFVLVSFSLMLFLSLSLVSAGWFSDFFTGKATDGSSNLKSITVSEGNRASLSCDSGGLITSANATYWCPDGSGRQRNCNVAGAIGLSSYSYTFTNTNCGGDPCEHVVKKGNLSISCEGANDIPSYLNCSDSDGGMNYYVPGSVSGTLSSGQSTNLSDGCIVSKDLNGSSSFHDGWLREAFCGGDGYATFTDYECLNGCFEGACVETSGGNGSGIYSIEIRGRLVDQLSGAPVEGAQLISAYEFSPSTVVTDVNGNFGFSVKNDFKINDSLESGQGDSISQWTFFKDCYGWSGNIVLQKDYELWEDGQLQRKYDFVLIKEKFDSKPSVIDISGKNEIEIGNVYAYPRADVSIQSDLNASFNVMYKYKNSEGYNGGGNSNFRNKHYSSDALPLDYEVYIQFEDTSGEEYDSSTYTVPSTLTCGVVSLKYFNGKSEWSSASSEQEFPDTPDTGNLPKKYYDVMIAKNIGEWEFFDGSFEENTPEGDFVVDAYEASYFFFNNNYLYPGDYAATAIVFDFDNRRELNGFLYEVWAQEEDGLQFVEGEEGYFLVNVGNSDEPFIVWTEKNLLIAIILEEMPKELFKEYISITNSKDRLEIFDAFDSVIFAYQDKYPSSDLDPRDFKDKNITLVCDSGCEFSDQCVSVGYRSKGLFCDLGHQFSDQRGEGIQCENNFECGSNFCVSGQCADAGLMQRIINWFKNLFG